MIRQLRLEIMIDVRKACDDAEAICPSACKTPLRLLLRFLKAIFFVHTGLPRLLGFRPVVAYASATLGSNIAVLLTAPLFISCARSTSDSVLAWPPPVPPWASCKRHCRLPACIASATLGFLLAPLSAPFSYCLCQCHPGLLANVRRWLPSYTACACATLSSYLILLN